MPSSVRFEVIDSVGVVTLDNPPVNAMSLEVRTGLHDALRRAISDERIRAIVLTGAGKLFSGGADIKEFDTGVSNQSPTLPDLIALVEDSPKPIVAALHGTAVGGGCELPLGCHARVAAPGTLIGLPEVSLGLVPGAGGTQRLPRLVGVKAALDAIVSGTFLKAEKAHALGLVDELAGAGESMVDVAVRNANPSSSITSRMRRVSSERSKTVGRSPRSTRALTTQAPMQPPAPVTKVGSGICAQPAVIGLRGARAGPCADRA
jgi:3-hydroxyacyl-CoA dehydrogenase